LEICKRVNHKNLLKFFDFIEGPKNYYFVYEQATLSPCSMADYLKTHKCLNEVEAKKLLYSLIKPLNYLHMGGAGFKVLHKNVKLS
jgi:serine/threonine protein kinase